jgi:hypothetical protein
VRVEPMGRGEVGGLCRDWKLELVGGAVGNAGQGRQFRDGGGKRTVWN